MVACCLSVERAQNTVVHGHALVRQSGAGLQEQGGQESVALVLAEPQQVLGGGLTRHAGQIQEPVLVDNKAKGGRQLNLSDPL